VRTVFQIEAIHTGVQADYRQNDEKRCCDIPTPGGLLQNVNTTSPRRHVERRSLHSFAKNRSAELNYDQLTKIL
jgi:hypothetical protein